MKFLIALFAFSAAIIGILVAILYEEGNMEYSDRLEVLSNKDCVVVLHGLKMGTWHTSYLASSLEKEGFDVYNIGYKSTKESIPDIVRNQIIPQLPQACSGSMHFVGHSLGGLLIRELLSQYTPKNMGKIVMLGTPNNGSEIVDFNMGLPIISDIFKFMFGPATQQMRKKDNPYLAGLLSPVVPTGIIAGDKFIEPVGALFILPKPNDGKVSVESTKLKTMTDFRLLPDSHFWLPFSHKARMQTIHFLHTSKFE